MSGDDHYVESPDSIPGRKMSREEILKAVAEGKPERGGKKTILVIPTSGAMKANAGEIASKLKVKPNSKPYQILMLFCEGKKASNVNAEVLIHRIKGLSDEQLHIVEFICKANDFTVKSILDFTLYIKKFGKDRILALRAFVDLKGMGPGPLHQFFMAALPRSRDSGMSDEAYKQELREKMMRPDQVDVFYNICHRLEGIMPSTAVAFLPKVRQLSEHHSIFINAFLKKGVTFGGKPIGNLNIGKLLNLFLTLPALKNKKQVKRLIKKLSKRPDKQKTDFQFLCFSFKQAGESQDDKSFGSGVLGLFSRRKAPEKPAGEK